MKRKLDWLTTNSTDFLFTGHVGNGDWLSNRGGASKEVIGTAHAAFDFKTTISGRGLTLRRDMDGSESPRPRRQKGDLQFPGRSQAPYGIRTLSVVFLASLSRLCYGLPHGNASSGKSLRAGLLREASWAKCGARAVRRAISCRYRFVRRTGSRRRPRRTAH